MLLRRVAPLIVLSGLLCSCGDHESGAERRTAQSDLTAAKPLLRNATEFTIVTSAPGDSTITTKGVRTLTFDVTDRYAEDPPPHVRDHSFPVKLRTGCVLFVPFGHIASARMGDYKQGISTTYFLSSRARAWGLSGHPPRGRPIEINLLPEFGDQPVRGYHYDWLGASHLSGTFVIGGLSARFSSFAGHIREMQATTLKPVDDVIAEPEWSIALSDNDTLYVSDLCLPRYGTCKEYVEVRIGKGLVKVYLLWISRLSFEWSESGRSREDMSPYSLSKGEILLTNGTKLAFGYIKPLLCWRGNTTQGLVLIEPYSILSIDRLPVQ